MLQASALSKKDTIVSMILIGVLFFVFGFVTWVNAILIPYFKIACELNNLESYFVAFAFYISYLVLAIPASFVLRKYGFKKGMMLGFFFMAAGAFTFIVAAIDRQYSVFLAGLFLIGTGLTILQTAANPYVTVLGAKERAAQRISIVGICNKGAGIIAPLLFAAVILRSDDASLFARIPQMGAEEREIVLDGLIRRVMVPYALVGTVLVILGLMVRFSPLPEIDTEKEDETEAAVNADKKSIVEFPHLILGAIAIFLHVGTQVVAVDTVIGYAASMNIQLTEAKVFPSYILTTTIVGYITGIICIPRFFSQTSALKICTSLGTVLSVLIVLAEGTVTWLGHTSDISLIFLVLLGLANSLIWAGIWPLALNGLGRFTKVGASLLVMGLCGNAMLPLVYGYFADQSSHRLAYWVLLPCYLYLLFYAFKGHKIRTWKHRSLPLELVNK
ncbi:MAG: sugar MFS transporter [Chitinophagaceae bacterium]|uniref:sugar MFS transporter n=1 Tax=unclassified Paraflavitalea TaxID=2798305 RepID=UPI003D33FDE4|nr:sugar MFS transporter [Chitinophagaceae bacterium]